MDNQQTLNFQVLAQQENTRSEEKLASKSSRKLIKFIMKIDQVTTETGSIRYRLRVKNLITGRVVFKSILGKNKLKDRFESTYLHYKKYCVSNEVIDVINKDLVDGNI